mmetsp:Transcript_11069/g.20123  ORF Transcript_11069/g.20123 Transcript_11069/m.20123 type:complete len:149 (-) Transcript_11069:143-589(-)
MAASLVAVLLCLGSWMYHACGAVGQQWWSSKPLGSRGRLLRLVVRHAGSDRDSKRPLSKDEPVSKGRRYVAEAAQQAEKEALRSLRSVLIMASSVVAGVVFYSTSDSKGEAQEKRPPMRRFIQPERTMTQLTLGPLLRAGGQQQSSSQ